MESGAGKIWPPAGTFWHLPTSQRYTFAYCALKVRTVRASFSMNVLGRFLALACVSLVLSTAFGQEPGQTPRPPITEPVREPTEEELVRLDKDFPEFAALKDDAPFALQ